jgi:hypothetical protein
VATAPYYSFRVRSTDWPPERVRANQGEYVISLEVGPANGEVEPNDTFTNATFIAVNDTGKFHMSGDSDVDIVKMELNQNHVYYITGVKYFNEWDLMESGVENGDGDRLPTLEVEVYPEDDTVSVLTEIGNYQIGDLPHGVRFGMPRFSGFIPPQTGVYYMKLFTFDADETDYWIRVVESPFLTQMNTHEPDNTAAEADAVPMLVPGVPVSAQLYPLNDIDLYKVEGVKGQRYDVKVFPPAHMAPRDMDTYVSLLDSTGALSADGRIRDWGVNWNDDYRNGIVWSRMQGVFPYTGTYYVATAPYYSFRVRSTDWPPERVRANQGEYVISLEVGSSKEQEPNNTPETATYLAVNDTIMMFAAGEADTDYVRITLSENRVYYFSSVREFNLWEIAEGGWDQVGVPKAAPPIIEVEPFLASDPSVTFARSQRSSNANERGMFRWSSIIPPQSGDWIFRLYSFDPDTTTYWIYLNEGPFLADLARWNEPNNTKQDADSQPALSLGDSLTSALYEAGTDIDLFRVDGTAGQGFVIWARPTAKQGYRDLDTYLVIWGPDGPPDSVTADFDNSGLFSNDDYVSGITWSRIEGTWPETGTYYVGVFSYYSFYQDPSAPLDVWDDPTLANVGEYVLSYEFPTGVTDSRTISIPTAFSLRQNYPNPFNPSTTIEYDLPKAAEVTLTVYNVLGARVKTLVNKQMAAGRYKVIWDATNDAGNPVATGVYFYVMKAGKFEKVRKLILMK